MLKKIRTWYKLHKWISIATGVLIILWLISGIIMVSPTFAPGLIQGLLVANPSPPDYAQTSMSPAEAVARLEEALERPLTVSNVLLRSTGETLSYQILLTNGDSHLIDTVTGTELVINEKVARQIAQDAYKTDAPIVSAAYLEHYNVGYLFGPLPVYRFVFDDGRATYIHVSIPDGQTLTNDRQARLLALFESFHNFAILRLFRITQEKLITLLLWTSLLVTLAAALIGYYLALPHRRRTRSQTELNES
ncbi:MAG: hypothetical protein GY796_08775 [Chloroflexi bacterium]|nr:hypothetical protein [Chloroflexota bacterium]